MACFRHLRNYLAFPGGLITGIFAPLSGGGTLISESRPCGGQITPFDSDSWLPSGSPLPDLLPPFAGGLQDCAGSCALAGGSAWANAGTLVSRSREKNRREVSLRSHASSFQQLPGTPGITLGLIPRIDPAAGWLFAAGTPF
jgi:hypothetical protein